MGTFARVPVNEKLLTGTVPVNEKLLTRTVVSALCEVVKLSQIRSQNAAMVLFQDSIHH